MLTCSFTSCVTSVQSCLKGPRWPWYNPGEASDSSLIHSFIYAFRMFYIKGMVRSLCRMHGNICDRSDWVCMGPLHTRFGLL